MQKKSLLTFTVFLLYSVLFLITCTIGLGESVDTEAPTGVIVSPDVDAVIRDSFAIKGTWSDDGTVSTVNVTLENTSSGEIFSYSADVLSDGNWYCEIAPAESGIIDGSYLATVTLIDTGAHQTELTRSYTIDNTPPLIVLNRPSTKASSASADSYGRTFSVKGQAADDNNVSKILVNVYDNSACSGDALSTITLTNVPLTIDLDVAEYDYDSDSNYKQNAYYKIYGDYDEDNPQTKEFYCTLTAYDDAATYPLEGEGSSDGNSTTSYYLYSDISTLISTYKVTEIYHMLNRTYDGDSATVELIKDTLDEKVVSVSKFSLNPDNAPTFTVEGCGKLSDGSSLLNESTNELSTSCKVTNDTKSFIITISPGRDEISIDADNSEKPLYVYLMQCDKYGNITGSTEIPLLKAYLNESGTDWIISDGTGSVEISDSSYVITTDTINTDYGIRLYNSTSSGVFYRVCVSAYDDDGNEVIEANSKIYAFGLASSAATIETSVSSSPSYLSTSSEASSANQTLTVTLQYSYTDTEMYLYRTIGSNEREQIGGTIPKGEDLTYTDTIPVSDLLNDDGSYASRLVYKFVSVNGENTAASNNKTVSIKYDNTIPVMGSVSCPTSSETSLSSFSFSGSASDADSGLSAVYISITDNSDASKTTGALKVTGTDDWTYKFTAAALPSGGAFDSEGRKTVKVWAVDNVGLTSEVYTNTNWVYDTSAPELVISSYIPGSEEAGVYTYSSDDAVAVTTNSSGSASFNIGKVFKLSGSASDNFGISGISVVQSDGSNSVTLSTDNGKVVYDSEISIWYIEDLPYAADGSSASLPVESTTYTYTFSVIDAAENSATSKTLSVVIDLEAPVMTITSPDSSAFGGDSLSGSAYTFRGTADDGNGLGMQYYKYAITDSETTDENTVWTQVDYTSSGNWSFSKSLGSGTSGSDSSLIYEGKKYIHVIGVDKADNESDVVTSGFMVDQSAPSVSVTVKAGKTTDGNTTYYTTLDEAESYDINDADSIIFEVVPSDSNGVLGVTGVKTLAGTSSDFTMSSNTDGSWTSEEITEEGSYTIVITAEDASGNALSGDSAISGRTTSVTKTIVFDKTAPAIESVSVNGSVITSATDNSGVWYNSNTVTVIVTASDNASGMSAVQYSSDNSTWQDFAISSGTYRANVEFSSDGENKLYLRASDVIGNVSEVFQTVDSEGNAMDGIVIKTDTSDAELEALFVKVGESGSLKTSGGTVYSNGSAAITIYGQYEDEQSGVGSQLTFTLGNSVISPTVTYSAADVTYDEDGSANSTWISTAEADSSETPFKAYSEFTSDLTTIKSWKAVYTPTTSGKFVISGSNGAGASSSTNAFTITFDTTAPEISNISLKTSSSNYSVYQPDSSEYTYWVNNTSGSPTFTLAGIATDNTGVDTVTLLVGSGDSAVSYDLDSSANASQWKFSGIDLSGLSESSSATVTVIDNAGNEVQEIITLKFDTTAPVSTHYQDAKGKDLYFRIGSQNNDTVTDSDLDEDVGGKYSEGAYANSTSMKIRGLVSESGSGLSKIYYKVYTSAPSNSGDYLKTEVLGSYTGTISPLSENETKRVYYNVSGSDELGGNLSSYAASNGSDYDIYYKEIESNFADTISGLSLGSNYLVLVAEDNVGNTYLDSVLNSNGYALINVDVEGPSITSDASSETIYSNGTTINGQSSYTLSGSVTDLPSGNAAGIDSMYLYVTVNGTKTTYEASLDGDDELSKTWTYSIPASVFANGSGNITVYAVATDLAGEGNDSATTSVATICVDCTAPTVTLASPTDADSSANGIQINGTISLSGSVSDSNTLPDSAVSAVEYSTDKSTWTAVTTELMSDFAVSGNYSYSVTGFDTTKLTDETTYYLRVKAVDAAGNEGYSSVKEVYVSQDTDRPVVTFTNLTIDGMASSNYVWLKNTTTLMGIVSDDDGISSMSYSISGDSSWTDLSLNNGSWSINLDEGSSTVYLKVVDSASSSKTFTTAESASDTLASPKLSDGENEVVSGIPVYIKVDKTSPVTRSVKYAYYDESLTSPAYSDLSASLDTVGGKRTKIQLNLDAGDENDIASVEVSITVDDTTTTYQGQQQTEAEEESDGKEYSNWTVSDIDVSNLSSGNQYASLTVTDKAGLTKTDSIVVSVDNTSSTVSVKSPATSTSVSGEVTAYGTLTESATLYYSVSPAEEDPDSISSVSAWYDGEGNSNSMSAVAVDGWTQVEDASLSWTVNFNNADSTSSGTNAKSLNKYIIDYGIASKDETSSATDAIVSSFETIVKLYLHLKSVDAVGNEYVTSYPILVDPQGDRPTVAFSYPSGNGVTLGGTVSIYGTATDTVGSSDSTIGVDSVWVQIKSTTHRAAEDTTTYGTSPSYDSSSDSVSMTLTEADLDYMAANGYSVYKVSSYSVGGTNTAWVSGSSSLASGESASDYAALASLSGAAWSIEINKTADSDSLYEFDPPSGVSSNPVAIRVFARDYDGKVSLKSDRYVSFDADTPVISELYLVQSSDGKIATASTASKAYSQDMYVKDSWYLTGTATDKDKIAVLKIGDTKLVDSSAVLADWNDCVTISSDGTTVEFKYPLATGSGVGALSFTVSATDAATGTSHTGSESISIKYDNTAPEIAASTSSAFNISSDICQSNSWYTFGSAAYEAAVGNASQSGFAYTAFYFKRSYTNASGASVNNIYDILQAKADAAVALGSATVPALGEESASSDNTIVIDSGLYWYRKAISNISGSTFTVTDTTGVRVNALMKIEGSLYLITAVNGSSVTVDATLPSGAELAYVAIAGIVDNTTPESAPSTGTIEDDGYYESPSRDDGDRMIESVDKSGTSWAWEANVCSRNIADGPITLYYVVFDKAGNYTSASVSGTVSNNKPRIAGAIVKTDYNGDGDVADDGETINTYGMAKSYAEYYTGTTSGGAYIFDPDEKVKNSNAKNPLPTSVTYGESGEPIAALRGYTLIQPEIVGGNGALYYSYKVTNGSNVSSGSNATAFIEEGSEDYTAVTGSINVQLGDLLNFGDTSDSASAIPFEFTIWDSTEGLTAFTSSQNAKLTMYFAIQAASVGTPSASITPFYWNSISDNSVYGSSSASSYADLKGHIELEDDLPSANFTSGGSGEYDLDPKVSGKITLAGAAEDTKLIALLTASIFGSSYEVATYSSSTGLLASNYEEDDFATNGFWFEIVDQTVDSDGHAVEWKLHLDTEKLSTAKSDLAVTISATNFGKPSASTGGTLTSIDGTTKYSSALTYSGAASSAPGTVQTSASAATAYYRMDLVPYVVGVKTSLSSLKKKNSSVYDRTALGHYPTAAEDSVYLYGFNLEGGTLYNSASPANSASLTSAVASSQSWYSSNYFTYDTVYTADVSSFTSGNVYVSVNGVRSLNNENSNNASGSYSAAEISDSSTYSVKNTYAYNRMPNNDNNNNLTDDLVLDVWAFDSDAVVPISGKIEQPHMAIDPKTGQIGFAFVNGPLYFSMAGSTENSTKTSYDYWMGSYDFFTSVGFTYDSLGYAYGVAAGGDINSASADKFQFMTSRWGRASRAQNGSYSSSNSLRMESIGQKGDSAGNNTDTRYFDKQRIKSPSLTTVVHDKYTNVYLAYYDAMNDEIRFKAGSTNSTSQTNFGSFTDYDTAGDPYVYRHEKVSMIAGSETGRNAGSYVSIAAIPGSTTATDVVVVVWYDETDRKLMYGYNTTPQTDRNGQTSGSEWTVKTIFSGDLENAGEYCQLAVDANGGIHIAAYDGTNCDLVYAYLSSYSADPSTCVVDGSGVIGSNLTIDVALDASGNAIPRIGYYATSCIRPKLAYRVDTASTAPAGSDDEAYTGAWECSVVPTDSSVNMQSNQYNKINVGVWKSSGVITNSTSGTSDHTNTPNSYNSTSYGFVYGNGTSNAVLGYTIKVNSSSDAIETAQMQ
ncbi:MAG: hypothetical protein J6J00_12285 [Treponema sp.]|nr:hypothetical protein [Treponema sp.]